MPVYHRLGKIPEKRHTQFRKADGSLFHEELFGTIGFDGMSSLLYHHHRPTQVKEIDSPVDVRPKIAVSHNIHSRKLIGFDVRAKNDFLESRIPLLINDDIHIGVAAPRESLTSYFYKNADADEMLFVHKGTGILRTFVGQIPFNRRFQVAAGVYNHVHKKGNVPSTDQTNYGIVWGCKWDERTRQIASDCLGFQNQFDRSSLVE